MTESSALEQAEVHLDRVLQNMISREIQVNNGVRLVKAILWIILLLGAIFLIATFKSDAEMRKKLVKDYPGPSFYLVNGKLHFDLQHRRMLFLSNSGDYYWDLGRDTMFNVQAIERANEESSNGHPISRAVLGGLIAGGAGAIVGAVSGVGNTKKVYLRRLEYRFNVSNSNGIETVHLIIADGVSDPKIVRERYEKFDKIGELLRSNLGVSIQHVD